MRKILLIIQCMPTAAQMWRRSVHNIKFMKFNIQFNENIFVFAQKWIRNNIEKLRKEMKRKKSQLTNWLVAMLYVWR